MPIRHRMCWTLVLGLAAAGCQVTVPPGPGGTPTPGGSPPPAQLASCEARFARFDEGGDRRWRIAETARWLYEFPLVPTYGPCAREVAAETGSGIAEPQCPLPPEPAAIMARLDRDGDQALTLAEACALLYEQVACEQRFAAADRDGDGAIVFEEFSATYPAQPSNPLGEANPPPPDVAFHALDRNGDGRLDAAEYCTFQRVTFALPTSADLSGTWVFGTTGEPAAGPVFGACGPGNGLRLTQAGDRVTGEETVCAGPCYVPTELEGTFRDGQLSLTGTVPEPAEDAGRRVSYALRYEPATGHMVGTRDGQPYWAAPYGLVESPGEPCPL